jgi:nitronate monooxygenase
MPLSPVPVCRPDARGSRFALATAESPIYDNVKHRLVEAGERDTRLIFRQLRGDARVADNVVARARGRELAEVGPRA